MSLKNAVSEISQGKITISEVMKVTGRGYCVLGRIKDKFPPCFRALVLGSVILKNEGKENESKENE